MGRVGTLRTFGAPAPLNSDVRPLTAMQGLRAFLLMLTTLVVANGTLFRILDSNLRAGIYPSVADSISIPLMEAASTSVLILLAVGASVSLPKRSRLWVAIRAIPVAFAALLSLALAASWFSPHHYPASAAFAIVAIACVWSWWQDLPSKTKDGSKNASS